MKNHPNNEKSFKVKASTRAIATAIAVPLASSLLINPVHAQDSAASARSIDEIVVTATRREGTVQDVPINIAALDGTRLQEQGFSDISELLAFVPGINAVNQGGRNGNQTIVRGLNAEPLGQGSGNDTGGTVATYLGEIPLPIDLRLNDLQRVEILLGPQGTLYGAGTLGGAIRYMPNRPDPTETMFEVRGDAYSVNEGSGVGTDFGATFNVPLSETFAIRGSVDRLDDQGYIDYPFVVKQPGVSEPDIDPNDPAAVAANFSPAEDVNTQETISGRIAARWTPNDVIDATVTYYFQNE